MALRSRYSQAFNSAAMAGPPIEVSGFTPGSVTTPAAILKGVSMYAKARRDEANYKIAADQSRLSMYAQALQTGKLEQDMQRVPYPGADGTTYMLSPAEAAIRASQDNPPTRAAVTPAGVPGVPDSWLGPLGITRSADGSVDPRLLIEAIKKYRVDHPASANRPASASQLKLEAQGYANTQFKKNDALLLGRHRAFLTGEPWKDGAGKTWLPDPKTGGYNTTSQQVALSHLGIDPEAWFAHDPARFPSTAKYQAGQAVPGSDANLAGRTAATAWREKTLSDAIATFTKNRMADYANQYVAPDEGAPAAPQTAEPDFSSFEQEFLQGLQGAAQ